MDCFLGFEGGTVLEWEVKVIQRDLLECAADPLTSPCWWTKKAGPVPLQGSPFSTVRAYSTFKSHQTRTIYGVQIRSPAPAYRGYNIRLENWCPRGWGLGDVEVHVETENSDFSPHLYERLAFL